MFAGRSGHYRVTATETLRPPFLKSSPRAFNRAFRASKVAITRHLLARLTHTNCLTSQPTGTTSPRRPLHHTSCKMLSKGRLSSHQFQRTALTAATTSPHHPGHRPGNVFKRQALVQRTSASLETAATTLPPALLLVDSRRSSSSLTMTNLSSSKTTTLWTQRWRR